MATGLPNSSGFATVPAWKRLKLPLGLVLLAVSTAACVRYPETVTAEFIEQTEPGRNHFLPENQEE